MSRTVYVGRDSRGYVSTDKSRVIWRTEVMGRAFYGDNKTLGEVLDALAEAKEEIVRDGIDPATIRVEMDFDSEPDYGGEDRITPKLVMTGERPATKAEVDAENERIERAMRQHKSDEAARLRARLAELERGR